jgi:hypothetical protein
MLDGYKRITNAIVKKVNDTVRPPRKTLEIFAPKETREEFLNQVHFGLDRELLLCSASEVSVRIQRDYFMTFKSGSLLMKLNLGDLDIHPITNVTSEKKLNELKHHEWHRTLYQKTNAQAVLLCHPKNIIKYMLGLNQVETSYQVHSFDFQPKIRICAQDETPDILLKNKYVMVQGQGIAAWGDGLGKIMADLEYLNWICSLDLT